MKEPTAYIRAVFPYMEGLMSEALALTVVDRVRYQNNAPTLSHGASDIEVSFDISSDTGTWDGFTLQGCFHRKDMMLSTYADLDSDNTCLIPIEAVREKGTLYVGLLGTREADDGFPCETVQRTSTAVSVIIT